MLLVPRIVRGIDAKHERTAVAELLVTTGYYDITARENLLNLSSIELQKQITVMPAEKYIHVLKQENNIVGFHLSLNQEDSANVFTSKRKYFRESAELDYVAKEIVRLYDDSKSDDFLVHFCAIKPEYQGAKLFSIMFNDIVKCAKEKHCQRLFLVTWEKNKKALEVFKHFGGTVDDSLNFTKTEYNDSLLNIVIRL